MTWDNNRPNQMHTNAVTIWEVTATTSNTQVVIYSTLDPDYRPERYQLRGIKLRDERAKWRR